MNQQKGVAFCIKIVYEFLKSLKEYENNPRFNDEAVDKVANSIKEFGFKVPIIVDKSKVIVAGHTRYKASKKLGLEKVPVIIADDLTEEQIKAFRLADNKVAEFSYWNDDLLNIELESLNFDMSEFGFEFGLSDFEDPVIQDDVPTIEEVPTVVKKGQIWQLGKHRLICGDSTKLEDINMLMNGEQADLYLTDPPYNVDYEGQKGMKIENDNMSDNEFNDFLFNAFNVANEKMKKGASFYIWHSDSKGFNFRSACINVGWEVKQCLIWNKNRFVMGRQDYQWKHEPCLYGWKKGKVHNWYSDRKQSTVLDFDKPKSNELHPTMKPIELIAYQINNSSKQGDIVLDSFGGSGTTLIACEQLNRVCYMAELDPKYCDVIIKRFEDLTGEKAILWVDQENKIA